MGTYRSNHAMMSEANRTAPIPPFPWIHPGAIFSTDGTGYNPFQASHFNVGVPVPLGAIAFQSIPGFPAPPIYHLYQLNSNVTTVHAKVTKPKKPKTSKRTSNDVPAEPSKKANTGDSTNSSRPVAKRQRKDLNTVTYGDISGIPAPFCSCTGAPRQCYRWGAGSWQSSCCTINISEYPLPMNVNRPGSRIAGRKMSSGAFEKLLQRLASGGYDLNHPIDLKEHWARHGTNKFMTFK